MILNSKTLLKLLHFLLEFDLTQVTMLKAVVKLNIFFSEQIKFFYNLHHFTKVSLK
jgi:hypothetical protein